MNQLKLNLELANSEEHEYRSFTIVLHQSVPKRITDRYRGCSKQQWWQTTETTTYWLATLYKENDEHSGLTIAEQLNKTDALLSIKTWIDIWKFGEKEKYRWQR